eukprot:Skav200163  [mRNA]  locus=scaffold6219:46085:48688:- [translate_table: standard]
MTPARTKFLRFIEDAEGLDSEQLLPRLEALQLHEELRTYRPAQERVVLCSRENKHYEALQILSIDLNDLSRAEIYCRLLMARLETMCMEKLSVFSANLPTWARGIVFGQPRHWTAASECSEVATEYREAILELLMGYAGHVDLPPNEAKDPPFQGQLSKLAKELDQLELPKSFNSYGPLSARCWGYYLLTGPWRPATTTVGPAESVAVPRRGLLSMLEENLSSMAYLKTFSAWTKERMRKAPRSEAPTD